MLDFVCLCLMFLFLRVTSPTALHRRKRIFRQVMIIGSNTALSILLALCVEGGESTQAWAQSATATTLTLSSSTVTQGTAVTMTAAVSSSGSPVSIGIVNFYQIVGTSEKLLLSSQPLTASSHTAVLKHVFGVGSSVVEAAFLPTSSLAGSTSSRKTLTVTGSNATTTSITTSGSAGSYSLTGTVDAFGIPAPTGDISFEDQSNSNAVVTTATLDSTTLASSFFSVKSCTTVNCPAGNNPYSIAAVDLNGDGILDLAELDNSGTINIYLGHGNGTFTRAANYSAGTALFAITTGDFNLDGIPDLAIAVYGASTVGILLGNGDGTFGGITTYSTGSLSYPSGVAVGDFDRDGIPDLAVSDYLSGNISILLGNGDGTFQANVAYPAGVAPYSLAVADFNGDGKLDLVAANFGGSISVLLGNGDGTFQGQNTYSVSSSPSGVAVGDFNGDGFSDIAVASSNIQILINHGDGTFANSVGYNAGGSAYAIVGGDFNMDGTLDLAVVNVNSNNLSLLLGKGDGTFLTATNYSTGSSPQAITLGDFNEDGLPDLAIATGIGNDVEVYVSFQTESAAATAVRVPGTPGTHNVFASYAGDTDHVASASGTVALTVVAPPTIAAAFSPMSISLNGTSTLTFTLTNPAANTVSQTGVAFSDILPSGLTIAGTSGLSNSCGGAATAVAGTQQILLTVGSIAAGSSCTISVDVTGTAPATYTDITGTVSSANGGAGNTASSNLTVTIGAYACSGANTLKTFTNSSSAGTAAGNIQTFAVPSSQVTIDALGAQGGAGGGLGAEVVTTTSITPGQTLCVLVGAQGGTAINGAGGGGGGSFVYSISSGTCASNLPSVTTANLLVAAGGGGGNGLNTAGLNGIAPTGEGLANASAGSTGDQGGGAGGTGGNGGSAVTNSGGGGSLLTDGASANSVPGGSALIGGGTGGIFGSYANGGFGGGGAAASPGGGGGGFNGGGAGGIGILIGGGGGGGSYSIASPLSPYTKSGVQTGNGLVSLCYIEEAPTSTTESSASATFSPSPQSVTLSATVTSSSGTVNEGSVSFKILKGGTAIGSATTGSVSNGSAQIGFVLPAGTAAGTYSIQATYSDATRNFSASSNSSQTLTIDRVSPTVNWRPAVSIGYGTSLSALLNATANLNGANVPGIFSYIADGTLVTGATVLGTGSHTVTATFTPSDAIDFAGATATTTLTITKAVLTVSADNAARAYGAANPVFSGSVTGAINGDTFTESFTTSATQSSAVGVYAIVPGVMGTNLNNYAITTNNGTLTVSREVLTVFANNATRVYGTVNPTFTGSITGAVNGDTFAENFTTTATQNSNVGNYAITPSIMGTNLSNYAAAYTNGTLTVAQAGSTTILETSNASIAPGQSITLTAQVASATIGIPTGNIIFYDGTAVLGIVALANGTANLATNMLSAGVTHALSATYVGDVNFLSSSTSSSSLVTVLPLDFTITVSGPSSATIIPGSSIAYSLVVDPAYGRYAGTVNFAISGLPAGYTATFSPAAIAANSGKQTITITVRSTSVSAKHEQPNSGFKHAQLFFALLILPLAGIGTLRRQGRFFSLVLLLAGASASAYVTGCTSKNGFFAQVPRTYTVTITTTAGSVQHTNIVTLNVE